MKLDAILVLCIIVLIVGGIGVGVYALRSLKQELHDALHRYAWRAVRSDSTLAGHVAAKMRPTLFLATLAGFSVGMGMSMVIAQVFMLLR